KHQRRFVHREANRGPPSSRPPDLRCVLPLWDELEGNRVHAVPRVLGCEPLTDKDVAEMAGASGALNFDATPIRIGHPPDGSFNFLIERRPTASSVELRIRTVAGRLATPADVSARQ